MDRLKHVNEIAWYDSGAHLILDEVAKRNLELFSSLSEGKRTGSLIEVLDQTVTPSGPGGSDGG
jgi:DNA mismatch repair protein MutS